MKGAYLGCKFTSEEVQIACNSQFLPFSVIDDEALFAQVAGYLDAGKVVGWFQDSMEFGPRALGNRSILGDARNTQMQSQMNLKIKQRESFRPFAPAVLSEDVSDWFEMDVASPYMLLVANVKNEHCIKLVDNAATGLDKLHQIRSSVPAITHVDHSARVQTVHKATNPKFHRLIVEFKKLSGVGMLINTSFNVRGEPPVCNPDDAIRCFLATDMDVLVMQNVLLLKSQQPSAQIEAAKTITFEKD